jgi:hypothetical protein
MTWAIPAPEEQVPFLRNMSVRKVLEVNVWICVWMI